MKVASIILLSPITAVAADVIRVQEPLICTSSGGPEVELPAGDYEFYSIDDKALAYRIHYNGYSLTVNSEHASILPFVNPSELMLTYPAEERQEMMELCIAFLHHQKFVPTEAGLAAVFKIAHESKVKASKEPSKDPLAGPGLGASPDFFSDNRGPSRVSRGQGATSSSRPSSRDARSPENEEIRKLKKEAQRAKEEAEHARWQAELARQEAERNRRTP